jgi:hypothetical protein
MSLPPSEIPLGAMRFNSDSQKLEYYDGAQWLQVSTFSPLLNGGARGLWAGAASGNNPTHDPTRNEIQYINISSTGNSVDFGDLTTDLNSSSGAASRTRAVFGGGSFAPARQTRIHEVTISSTGNATNYGDLSVARAELGSASNQTRAVWAGGSATPGDSDEIDYITIASGGTAVDWGTNLPDARERVQGGINSPTRGLFYGGQSPVVNTIDFITIPTTGTYGDFGDMLRASTGACGASNSVRGILAGDSSPGGTNTNSISYVTIASTGNAVEFGDRTVALQLAMALSSPTRVVIAGGYDAPGGARENVMDYVNISTQGNAVDFGDLTGVYADGAAQGASTSNAHGGL